MCAILSEWFQVRIPKVHIDTSTRYFRQIISIHWTRSQHIWQQRNVARQLINLWLIAISSLFDRVTADKQTRVWQQQLNSALHIDTNELATIYILSIPVWAPSQGDPLRISVSNLAGKELRHWATFYIWKLHDPGHRRFVTIHSCHRQMTDDIHTAYYDNSRTLHCNGRLKMAQNWTMTRYISKIRPDTISICLSFWIQSTNQYSNLKRKPETEIVLSAILTKNRRKRPKITGIRSAFRKSEAPQIGGCPPARRSDSAYNECICEWFLEYRGHWWPASVFVIWRDEWLLTKRNCERDPRSREAVTPLCGTTMH